MTIHSFNYDRPRLAHEVILSITENREPADRMRLGRQQDASHRQNMQNRGKPFLSKVYQHTDGRTMDDLTSSFAVLDEDLQAITHREVHRKFSELQRVKEDEMDVIRAAIRVGIIS